MLNLRFQLATGRGDDSGIPLPNGLVGIKKDQCGKSRILLPLKLYVKPILAKFEPQNLPFSQFKRPRIYEYWQI